MEKKEKIFDGIDVIIADAQKHQNLIQGNFHNSKTYQEDKKREKKKSK